MGNRNGIFIRLYFQARKEAEAAGLDNDQAKGYAVATARMETSALVSSILYAE